MVNYCVAPGCEVGSKTTKNKKGNTENENKVSVFHFPGIYKEPERRRIWEASVPRESFKASNNSVLCEKHFVAGDFVTDSNKWRKKTSETSTRKKNEKKENKLKKKTSCKISEINNAPIVISVCYEITDGLIHGRTNYGTD